MEWLEKHKHDYERYALGVSKLKPEQALQIAVVRWIDAQLPHVRPLMFASAGGLFTSKKQGYLMKRAGYRKGTPDLFFAIPKPPYFGLWIEVKTEKGTVSREQKECVELLREQGYQASVEKGWKNITQVILEYFE